MVGLLFHVLYLLSKCIYDRYRVRKTRLLPDVANEEDLFRYDCDTSNDVSEVEDTSRWADRTMGTFQPPAYIQRYSAVAEVLDEYKGKLWKIVDFGCAEINFLRYLKELPGVEEIFCVDVDRQILEANKDKAKPLITEMMSPRQRELTIEICEGSVTDNDIKLKHADAVICIELIEHLYPDTLIDLPFNIFGYIKPEVAIITTPNVEFNVLFPNMSGYRHPDHKFEWTRKQFEDWAQNIVIRYPYYSVTFHGICNGPEGTEELGALTQMAVFRRILPRNESRLDILIMPDEYIQLRGQHELFKTVAKYNYSAGCDIRSDEQKILDEATYYINYLFYNTDEQEEPRNNEISLDRIVYFMTKYTVTIETLRSILTDGGWIVKDTKDGPVVLVPYDESSNDETPNSEDYIDDNYMDGDSVIGDWDSNYENSSHEEFNSTNVENIWDYVTGSPIDEIPADANERNLSQQDPHIEGWHEEPNIINEERWDSESNSSINAIFRDANEEYLPQQRAHTVSWYEESNITNENRLDYETNPPMDETLADESEYLSEQHCHTEYLSGEPNFTNEVDGWDSESSSSINQLIADAKKKICSEEYLSAQNPHIENWHEEPSIIIPENCSINQENTYLFDGENSLIEEAQSSTEPYATYDDIKHSGDTAESLVYTERELPSDSVSLTLNEIEVETQVTASNMPSTALNNSLQLKTSVDNVTVEPALQNEQINIRPMQGVTSILNVNRSHMSVSHSSTSPTSLYFSSVMNNSLQDFSVCCQNESSIDNQYLLNSTFYQSEIATEAAINTQKSTAEDTLCFKKSLPEKDTQENETNFSLHMPPNYSNCNAEQERNISDKNQISKDNDSTDVMSSDDSFNNQPKYTSSPHTKMPTTTNVGSRNLKYRELLPAMSSNVLLETTEEIKETVSDTTDSNLLETSQKSNNSITETIKLYATSSNSDITNTLSHDISYGNNTQQKLHLENKEFRGVANSSSTELIQKTNQEFVENNIIDHEDDIQNVDTHHVLSLGNESTNHKNKNVYCTLAKTDLTDIDAKAHLENMISDLAQSSIRKKDLNPPRELLSSKSQSVHRYSSSDCAKETSVLRNDRFVPCKSSEDTSTIHFTSVLKNEETVGTSRDVSNIAGLVNNVEAKASSPLETPPNSWSPEIMDSGYPNSASAQDITPEYELPSIAQDYIPDSESPSVAEAPRLGVLEPIEVENGDLANNNRDDEGNNMMAVDANDIANLQPLIDVLENDLENENDIYVMQNGFPIWLLRLLDMANPLDFDMQARQNLRIPEEVADDANYVGHDEGFDSSSSESESDVAYNEMEDDNGHGK